MPRKCKFRTQSLLYGKNGRLHAAMSPMGFADEIAERLHKPINILVRIWFDDDAILQQNDYGERTGYDRLILGYQDENEFWLSFWVTKGQGVPVAMAFGSDRKTWMSVYYKEIQFIKKLQPKEMHAIFQHLFDHPEELATGFNWR